MSVPEGEPLEVVIWVRTNVRVVVVVVDLGRL